MFDKVGVVMKIMGQFLTVKDASRLLGVSQSTLRNWDKTGKLKSQRNPYNGYRIYKKEDIEKILSNLHAPTKTNNTFTKKKDLSEFIDKVLVYRSFCSYLIF